MISLLTPSGLLQENSEDIDGLLLRARAFYYKGEPWSTVNPFLVNILTLDPDNKEAMELRKVRGVSANYELSDSCNLADCVERTCHQHAERARKRRVSQPELRGGCEAVQRGARARSAERALQCTAALQLRPGEKQSMHRLRDRIDNFVNFSAWCFFFPFVSHV